MYNTAYSMAIQRAAEPAPCGEITAELFEKWTEYIDGAERTRQTYTGNIRRFSDWLRVNGIQRPERPDILNYRNELSTKYKPATVHGYLIAVKLFFQWTEQAGIYPDIAKRIKGEPVDPYYKKDPLTGKQAAKVLENINENTAAGLRDYALISLMLTTGLRTNSIILADIGDIRTLEGIPVLYYQGKGHKEKAEFVKLSEPVLKAIQRYLETRGAEPAPHEPLFASVAHRNAGKRLTTRSISRIVKEALKAAGLESDRLTAHSLRHTAANLAIRNGAPLREVQQLLGHKNINITMIYLEQIKRTENTSTDRITAAIFG